MHIERFTKAQRRKTRHKEHMGTPKQSCSNLHSAVRCVHVSQGYGRWLSLREYAWFVKSWLCPCRSLFFVVTRCGIVTSTVLLYYAWSHIDLRVLLRQESSKPTRIHLFGCRRLSSRWPCRWPGSRKSFHNVQRCAKILGFARKHLHHSSVAKVSSFCCTEASPFASVEDQVWNI